MDIVLILLVLAAACYILYRRNAGWTTVSSGIGPDARRLEDHYRYLKSQSIRCRLKSNADSHLGTIQTAAAAVDPLNNEHLQLDVHTEDIHKASELLQQLQEPAPYGRNTP
ncbi:hypothetical protein ACVNS2_36490 [Paenibacillus caseinilyticus]|uniref:Uncharacterized protein n=1 Tax=Paenibacillus mucilaginosus K02 TaxID=997761 RepID=I0BUY8_9BACL|nr:hypothetical protein [Paenibacillus mucilaginosus]AFH66185.1 hypothetical protein B2K_36750 [Paenibacillus mucilaginosus K02]